MMEAGKDAHCSAGRKVYVPRDGGQRIHDQPREKIDEEVAEYHESKELEELADILEVVCALCSAQGHSADELMRIYEKKHIERGGFSKRIFLLGKDSGINL